MTFFLSGFLFLLLGMFMIFIPTMVFRWFSEALFFGLIVHACLQGQRFFRGQGSGHFVGAAVSAAFAVFILFHQQFPACLLHFLFGCYCLFSGLLSAVQFLINRKNHADGGLFFFFHTAAAFSIGVFALTHPNTADEVLQIYGLYFILLGIRYLHDARQSKIFESAYHWHRKLRIAMPALAAAWLPSWFIHHFIRTRSDADRRKSDEQPDLKIMVHVGEKGIQKIGHITFCLDNIVYSFGNYDRSASKLGSILGDGIFFTAPYRAYMKNIIVGEKNTIVEFGIRITAAQKKAIQTEIEKLKTAAVRWHCPLETDASGREQKLKEDYACRVYARTGAQFYKFTQGIFKKYWAFGGNCALFVDQALKKLQASILDFRLIMSPGIYFDWLESEFAKKNSPVISRTVYLAEDFQSSI
jgi:uncharacterized membrane protein HdeD (DUF308 family)